MARWTERGRMDARAQSRRLQLGGQQPRIGLYAHPGRGNHPPSSACAGYFFGFWPFVSSWLKREAASVLVFAGVCLIFPVRTFDARVWTFGLVFFLDMVRFSF